MGASSRSSRQRKTSVLPNAVYRPETCIRATPEAADRLGFAKKRLMFEVTEGERVENPEHLHGIFAAYRKQGFRTAIDDFGAGYAGLNLLADFQPDYIKLDMQLTRNIDKDRVRQAIVRGIMATSHALSLGVIAEGVETREECLALRAKGVELFQGYFFARPAIRGPTTRRRRGARLRDLRATRRPRTLYEKLKRDGIT